MQGRKRYMYPDLTIVCGRIEVEAGTMVTNPKPVVEVLSKHTEQAS